MDATRTECVTVNLAPEQMAALTSFAKRHRWTISTAAVVLMERGLAEDPE